MSRALLLLSVLVLFFVSCLAHETCQNVLSADPTSFIDGSQHSDCDYEVPAQTAATDAEHAIDVYWVNYTHQWAIKNMPSLPFGAAIVDSRTNTLVAVGTNMFNSEDFWFSQQVLSHAETVVITNATIHSLPDTFNKTTGKRKPHSDWKYMTLYGNIETCPMCAQGAIWRGLRRMVFGARASALSAKRCWSQPSLTVYEVADQNSWATFQVIRGPMTELENEILLGFSNSCKAPTPTPTTLFTCAVDFNINTQPPNWPDGMTASLSVSVSNPSLLKVNGAAGWNVVFSTKGNGVASPFQISNSWNTGSVTSTTSTGKTTYTVKNADYNTPSPSFGFNAATTAYAPYNNICGVSINGVACSVNTPSTVSYSC